MKHIPTSKMLLLAAGVLAAISSASAGTVTYNYDGITAGGVNMGIEVGSTTGTGLVGQFIMTTTTPGFTSPLLTYCTDVGANLQPSFNYTPTALSSATGLTPPSWISGGIQNAATLWVNDQAGATTAAQTAGLQLALWELLYNPVAGSYSVSTLENSGNGGFHVTTTDANSIAAMNAAVTDLNGFSSLTTQANQVEWLAPTEANGSLGGSQGLLYLLPTGVPETTSTLGLLGLAAIGLVAANRKWSVKQS